MAKTITFTYEGRDYTLEFTRKTVETMEKQGFVAADVQTKPITVLPKLFAGAFLAHHRYAKNSVIDEIFSKLTNKQELVEKLAEMYSEPILALVDDPENIEGNLAWGADW